MPALVAGIHALRLVWHQIMDGRDKPGHDGRGESSSNTVGISSQLAGYFFYVNCPPFAAAAISAGVPPGSVPGARRGTRYRETGTSPCGGSCCGTAVTTGCITLFTTYSPIWSPISVPTRVEKR